MRIPAYEKKIKRELRVNQFNNCLQITMAMTVCTFSCISLCLLSFLLFFPPSFPLSLPLPSLCHVHPHQFMSQLWYLFFLALSQSVFLYVISLEQHILVYHLAYLSILIFLIFRALKKSVLRYWWWTKLSCPRSGGKQFGLQPCDFYCNFSTLPW